MLTNYKRNYETIALQLQTCYGEIFTMKLIVTMLITKQIKTKSYKSKYDNVI